MMSPPFPKPSDPPVETVRTTLTAKLGWIERLRVLFGRPVVHDLQYDIWVVALSTPEGKPEAKVIVHEHPAKGWVEPIFKPKATPPDVSPT